MKGARVLSEVAGVLVYSWGQDVADAEVGMVDVMVLGC